DAELARLLGVFDGRLQRLQLAFDLLREDEPLPCPSFNRRPLDAAEALQRLDEVLGRDRRVGLHRIERGSVDRLQKRGGGEAVATGGDRVEVEPWVGGSAGERDGEDRTASGRLRKADLELAAEAAGPA